MLRLPMLALACLFALPAHAARAETEPGLPPSPSLTTPPDSMASDGSPHIATAAKASSVLAAAEEDSEAGKSDPAGHATADSETEKSKAVAKPAPALQPTLTAQIDLARQTMVVAEDGEVKYTWPVSSGTAEFPTPRGTFHPQWVAKMWYSKKYDNAPMPNAVFINGGVAVHATQHVRSLGQPASHGCIRLAPVNAKIFYNLVERHGLKMTRVSIFGTPKWRAPAVASRPVPSRQRYVQRDDNDDGWFSSRKSYRAPVSAYDPRFTQQRYRQPQRYSSYDYGYGGQRYYYRSNSRVVYVQRPPRRVYYYNNNGWGGW